jgi:hypothetical protein
MCAKEVTTFVKTEYNIYAFLLAIFILYFYGLLYGLALLIIVIPLCKNVTHSCPYCEELLLVKRFYPIQIKDNVKEILF